MAKKETKTAEEMMSKHLANILSDTYVLAVKTHGYHWNVTGAYFASLHKFFGDAYEGLIDAADEIAERIRALGMMPDGSMDAFLQNTVIQEAGIKPMGAREMMEDLILSHGQILQRLEQASSYAAEIRDPVTADLLVRRQTDHEKTRWMLKSHLG